MNLTKFKATGLQILLVLTATAFIVVLSSSIFNKKAKYCKNVSVNIDHDKGLYFIEEEDIKKALLEYCGDSLTGMNIKEINFAEIEKIIEENPHIQNAEVYSNIKGSINVEIEQKEPLIRVVNNLGVSYYMDKNGEKMPVSPKFTARVVVATGNIKDDEESAVATDLYELGSYIHQDEFWMAQFEQIHVNEYGEFELIPKLENHVINIGGVEELEGKFSKLLIFYKEVLKNVTASDYKVINLKFDDQIVCTKI